MKYIYINTATIETLQQRVNEEVVNGYECDGAMVAYSHNGGLNLIQRMIQVKTAPAGNPIRKNPVLTT